MKIPPVITLMVAGVYTPIFTAYAEKTVTMMLPWLLVMIAIIITDLAAGIRKSLKLGVDVSVSTAARETISKIVVYTAFVITACMIDTAANGDADIAKWCCLLVCVIEGGSIISNMLKPYGVDLSLKNILAFFLKRSPLHATEEEAKELFRAERKEVLREKENSKWNTKHRKKERR